MPGTLQKQYHNHDSLILWNNISKQYINYIELNKKNSVRVHSDKAVITSNIILTGYLHYIFILHRYYN